MTGSFGEHATADEVLGQRDLSALRVLITGASSGLGLESARALAARGASVMLTVRDAGKAKAALEDVRAKAAPSATVEICELDLASFKSICALSGRLIAEARNFNVIMANAGVMACPQGQTADGFELQFGTNHLGHFLFVNRLVPLLVRNAPARVVVLSSGAHRRGNVDLGDPNFVCTPYDRWVAYGRSKTANALYAVALDKRLRDRGIRACAISPGAVGETALSRHLSQEDLERIRSATGRRPVFKTLTEGAATQLWATAVADADEIGGRYCESCSVAETITDPAATNGVLPYAVDAANAEALWTASEKFVGETFSWA
jgi:NAD(P)-dependent dehydrogenase (short-subunit alcohol dehydrogenase family)